jgi:anti-sigma regulatory factor (Ser/Thr protein kinase)
MTEIDDRVRLAPDPASAGTARRFVARALDGCDVDHDLVALLVSELVTNVVLHAHTPFEVSVRSRGPHIRITVTDGSAAMPAMKQYSADSVTGRGLNMIDGSAAQWGVDESVNGKAVWFEVPVTSAAPR